MEVAQDKIFKPRVTGETTTLSQDIDTLLNRYRDGKYYIPEYQRDSSQWDVPKKSLFIDSIINNLTIPPLIVYPHTDEKTKMERRQVVDGQQRLTTISDFVGDKFALAAEEEAEYADNVGPIIQKCKFSELPPGIREQIKGYIINFVVLPKDIPLSDQLEIFRRINEAGVPLSPQDLRLAAFSQSERVYLIRLAGIFDRSREGSTRMIKAAEERFALAFPWKDESAWSSWWIDTAQATGQNPSQMFLYYVIAQDLSNVEAIIASSKIQEKLRIRYDRTTTSVLDLYVAQLQDETQDASAAKILASITVLKGWFETFEIWFNTIKTGKVARISPNSSTKVAFFIAAAAREWDRPDKVTEKQWEGIQIFLTQGPKQIEAQLGTAYPIAKGKWPGQKSQIEKTFEICHLIATK